MIPGDKASLPVRIGALLADLALFSFLFRLLEALFVAFRTILGADILIWVSCLALFEGSRGATPGKRLLGIRVVGLEGGAIEYPQALLRALIKTVPLLACQLAILALQVTAALPLRAGMAVPGAILVLAWVWTSFRSPLAQAPHDQAARTRVIRSA